MVTSPSKSGVTGNRDVGEKFPNLLYCYKSLSEPVAWLKTILIQAVLWQFPWFAFPGARKAVVSGLHS
jgi:hypothetical protein